MWLVDNAIRMVEYNLDQKYTDFFLIYEKPHLMIQIAQSQLARKTHTFIPYYPGKKFSNTYG